MVFTARVLDIYYRTRYRSLKVFDRQNFPKTGNFLIVANHLSNWDPPLMVIAAWRPMGFVAKEELFDKPRFGKLIEFYGAISVNREKPERSTIKSVKQIFGKGWCLGMFIEGTRSKTPGVLGRPHLGPAWFARSNNVPIIPLGIVGTEVKGGDVVVRVGKPIQADHDLEATTWRIMESLADLTGFELRHRELAREV